MAKTSEHVEHKQTSQEPLGRSGERSAGGRVLLVDRQCHKEVSKEKANHGTEGCARALFKDKEPTNHGSRRGAQKSIRGS